MKGHTVQFVITRVHYIQDSLCTGFAIRREFVRGLAKFKGPDIFLLYRKISYSRVSYYRDSTVD